MPNSTSLIRRLADLRSQYTGETDSAVLPAICHGTTLLTREDRAQVLDALDGDGPLPEHIRRAILPDASTVDQQELEAAVLRAASRAVHLAANPLTDKVFRMSRPLPDQLVLHLAPQALRPLVQELLPLETEDGLDGYPCLRARMYRRHVELHVPGASVHLANVSYTSWQFASEGRWTGNDADPPTPAELDALAHRDCGRTSPATASALLRRICLFPVQPLVIATPEACYLDWAGEPNHELVRERLDHPLTGVPVRQRIVLLGARERLPARVSGQPPSLSC
ncbi:hypothetical protein GCM10010174_86610 [Kutzneria viridogrisea]|uniref:Uncharacterized protein n=1 Tax=Kutzneria viridogrisea TaxID=47990 RepID=A0ABR6BS30_9PSEU|nr:hypothetical protein [Kutzneria viridogrisea]